MSALFNTHLFLPVLGEWCDGSMRVEPANQQLAMAPALQFVWDGVLQVWCRQAQWMEEALGELRPKLGPQLQGVSLLASGRALGMRVCARLCTCVCSVLLMNFPNDDSGHFLCEKIGLEEPRLSADVAQALAKGLAALSRQEVRILYVSMSKSVKVHHDVLPPSVQTFAVPCHLFDSLAGGTIRTSSFPKRYLQSPRTASGVCLCVCLCLSIVTL